MTSTRTLARSPRSMTNSAPIRLDPAALRRTAERQLRRIETELPDQKSLAEVATLTFNAVVQADALTRQLRRWFTLHHLPSFFLAVAVVGVSVWVWLSFFHTSTLTLALSDRDARALRAKIADHPRVRIDPVLVNGSREALEQLRVGAVDLGFVQGGFAVPPPLLRREVGGREVALLFVRKGAAFPQGVRTVVTSTEGEGSHTVFQQLAPLWHLEGAAVRFTFGQLAEGHAPEPDVDAVFVSKDPSDDKTLTAVATLDRAGFELRPVTLGARLPRYDFAEPFVMPAAWFDGVPATPVETIAVKTYLVARAGLTPRLLAEASTLTEDDSHAFTAAAVMPSTEVTSEALQGVDAFVGILVNIALAFLGLLGFQSFRWRRPFHELNALVSRLSLLQSQTDMLDIDDVTVRRHNRLVLGLVSDQLGLISSLASFYTQENEALLFNSLSELVHERCSALKLNIQLKILQSNVRD